MALRSSAFPLSLLFAALILYASLYPFDGWRLPATSWWGFLWASWPRYWTWFDLLSNLVGYVPLGFLLALGWLRSGAGRWTWALAVLISFLLSLGVEVTQNFLPTRVPSNVDLVLNTAGAVLGSFGALTLDRLGVLRQWSLIRLDWFVPQAHGSLVLLTLWPFALLYPASVPFGLGQVLGRIEEVAAHFFDGSLLKAWLPLRAEDPVALGPLAQAFCVALGLLVPTLMAFADVRGPSRRMAWLMALLVVGLGATGLSSALTYGPEHAWAWMDSPTILGLWAALFLGVVGMWLSPRMCHTGLVVAVTVLLTLLNLAPSSAYLNESLQVWEQGQFIRFHGLSQWLGWLWPYAALIFAVRAVSRPSGQR